MIRATFGSIWKMERQLRNGINQDYAGDRSEPAKADPGPRDPGTMVPEPTRRRGSHATAVARRG